MKQTIYLLLLTALTGTNEADAQKQENGKTLSKVMYPLDHAEQLGMGSQKYELVKLD